MEFCVTFMWVMVGQVARSLAPGWRRWEEGADVQAYAEALT